MIGPIVWWSPPPPLPSNGPLFRAVKSATTQAGSTGGGEVVFDDEVILSDAFAANRFTVPVELNGYYILFTAGVETDNFEQHNLALEVSTNGGGAWSELVLDGDYLNQGLTLTSGPILASTGDIYRINYTLIVGASSMVNSDLTFFSGYVLL